MLIVIFFFNINFSYSQELNIDEKIISLLISQDSSFYSFHSQDSYSSTIICLNCNPNSSKKFKHNNFLIRTLDEKSCITYLKKHKAKEFLAMKIHNVGLQPTQILFNYSIGFVKNDYYNEYRQLMAEVDERNFTLPIDINFILDD